MTATVAAPDSGVASNQNAAQPLASGPAALVPNYSAAIHAAPYTNVNATQNAAVPLTTGPRALIVLSSHPTIPAPFFGAIIGGGGGQVGYAN